MVHGLSYTWLGQSLGSLWCHCSKCVLTNWPLYFSTWKVTLDSLLGLCKFQHSGGCHCPSAGWRHPPCWFSDEPILSCFRTRESLDMRGGHGSFSWLTDDPRHLPLRLVLGMSSLWSGQLQRFFAFLRRFGCLAYVPNRRTSSTAEDICLSEAIKKKIVGRHQMQNLVALPKHAPNEDNLVAHIERWLKSDKLLTGSFYKNQWNLLCLKTFYLLPTALTF